MNIELKELVELFSSKNSENIVKSELIGERVIVRSRDAGVMYGTLESVSNRHVVLKNARMLWRWKNANKGISLNDTAIAGVENDDYSRLSNFNKHLEVLDACTIIKCEKEAIKSLDNYEAFKND